MIQKPKLAYNLIEYDPYFIPSTELPFSIGEKLWHLFDQQRRVLQVGFPSPKTDHQWSLISNGWVGFIQASPEVQLQLSPRFPLQNLFSIWAYAYGFNDTPLMNQLVGLKTVSQFQAVLGSWLASEVLNCAKVGFAKAYLKKEQKLPYIHGRFKSFLPGETAVLCQYDELTSNIPDNQILAYTLNLLSRATFLAPPQQALIRQATHLINQVATPVPISAEACYGRIYSRLTQRYQLMHQLCGFFIEQISPQHDSGTHPFPAFLIHMPRLFERFVATWISQNLPYPWYTATQEKVVLGNDSELMFQIDIVLYNKRQQKPFAVLDTKYKKGSKIASSDIHQLITYAKVKSCNHAILIFPSANDANLNVLVDDIRLQAMSFNLNESIDVAGQTLISQIKAGIRA